MLSQFPSVCDTGTLEPNAKQNWPQVPYANTANSQQTHHECHLHSTESYSIIVKGKRDDEHKTCLAGSWQLPVLWIWRFLHMGAWVEASMAYRTVMMYMEIGCFVLCVSGWILVCSTMPTEIWTWSEVGSTVLTSSNYFSNLWKDCISDSTGVSDCKGIPSMLALNCE